jgi:hypothetical protein
MLYISFGSNTPIGITANGTTTWDWCGNASATGVQMEMTVKSPFAARAKSYSAIFSELATGGVTGNTTGWLNSTASATGFTITTNTGTLTGGTIYVYGYGTS